MINFNSPTAIHQLLESHNLSFRKRWGQNFLISAGTKDKLIRLLDPGPKDSVWEIGPGIGSLSVLIAERAGNLSLFEIDPGYVKILRTIFDTNNSVAIWEGDFLKSCSQAFFQQNRADKIFGNLPYNVGSAIIGRLIEENIRVDKMVFTLQKEVAKRVVASPGTKEYSSFSMMVQFMYTPVFHGSIAPGSFYPKPNVTSGIVELIPHDNYKGLKDRNLYFNLVKDLFSSRRKTIRNALRGGRCASLYGLDNILNSFSRLGVDTGLRGERLSVQILATIAQDLEGR